MEQENTAQTDNTPVTSITDDSTNNLENLPTLTSFQFTPQFIRFFERLTTSDEWRQMLEALYTYAFEGKELPLTGTVLAVFSFAKDEIDKQRQRLAMIAEHRSKAGKEGALALYRKRLRAMARKEKRQREKELAQLQSEASESPVDDSQANTVENVDNQPPLT